jgi:miniconductance mechanosensitive channel
MHLSDLSLQWFLDLGFSPYWAKILTGAVAFAGVVLLALVADMVAKRLILRGLTRLIERTKTKWDDALLARNVLNNLAHLAPALVIYVLTPVALRGFDQMIAVVVNAAMIYIVVVFILALDSLLNAALDIYQNFSISKEIHIKGFVQVVKLVIYFIAGVFIVSTILGKSPVFLLSGLGAMTAVLMLIFKDAILGLVAGIQLTANRMVAKGDWIEMPKYGADGDVLEVTLTTVKVQNWDKTITTIPTYALISESFRNWRGMQESGGRRIKRAVFIDVRSIKFCNEEMLERFRRIRYIADYIEQKKQEITKYNASLEVDDSSLANGRRMTNVGTFRAYVKAYLRNHPMIHQDLTFLVRQLAPSERGLPIEIYVFSSDTAWVNYEGIQADIFDHILAVLPEFDLSVFQYPTGSDVGQLGQTS